MSLLFYPMNVDLLSLGLEQHIGEQDAHEVGLGAGPGGFVEVDAHVVIVLGDVAEEKRN